MEKVNILIVEDELIVAEDISDCLLSLGYCVTGIADSYTQAIELLKAQQPDIVVVDIMLKGTETGIDLGHFIRNTMDIPFIYLTSHSNKYIVKEASKSNPDAYLVKPFKEEELYTSIEIALINYAHKRKEEIKINEGEDIIIKDSIFIKCNGYFSKLRILDIVYLKSDGNYLELYSEKTNKCVIRATLKEFMNGLPKGKFIRVHNSYMVNIDFVVKITYTSIFVSDYEIPISRNRKDELMKKIQIYS